MSSFRLLVFRVSILVCGLGFVHAVRAQCELDKLRPTSISEDDRFGSALSVRDSVALIGAPAEFPTPTEFPRSAAFVYRAVGGNWTMEQKLLPSDITVGTTFDFGRAVAIDEDLAVVGAPYRECNGESCGAAYVFRYGAGMWNEETILLPSDTNELGTFGFILGHSVAVDGNVVVAGAPWHQCANTDFHCGAAYVYRHDGLQWVEEAILLASDGASQDYFGYSVAIDGDRIVVGAAGDGVAFGQHQGLAYVFRHNGSGWTEEQKLTGSSIEDTDGFGLSVSIEGTLIAVGAPLEDSCPTYDCGSVWVYRYNGTSWAFEDNLVPPSRLQEDNFGRSVAVCGDMVAVGSHLDDTAGCGQCGSVTPFRSEGGTWVRGPTIVPDDLTNSDHLGWAVAVSAGEIFGSTPNDACGPLDPFCGAVHVLSAELRHGDIAAPQCVIDVDDLLYVLNAFAHPEPCAQYPGADLIPCGGPCGTVDVDDILSMLGAFGGLFDCPLSCSP